MWGGGRALPELEERRQGRRGPGAGGGRRVLRLPKTTRTRTSAEQREATGEMSEGGEEAPFPTPVCPQQTSCHSECQPAPQSAPPNLQAPAPLSPEPPSSEKAEDGRRRLALTRTPLTFFPDSISGHTEVLSRTKPPPPHSSN